MQLAAIGVQATSGRLLGSGFFCSPRLVVTCAHVLSEEAELGDLVSISSGSTILNGTVVHCPKQRGPEVPDVAVIELVPDDAGPDQWPPLATDIPDRGSVVAIGMSSVRKHGDPVTLQVEGHAMELPASTGPALLKLKGGQLIPGHSGSAVLNENTGEVVGMITRTRGDRTDLGGIAISSSVLREILQEHLQVGAQMDDSTGWHPLDARPIAAICTAVSVVVVGIIIWALSASVECISPLDVRTWPDPSTFTRVQSVREPDYSAYEILREQITLDLTLYRDVPASEAHVRCSPAIWTREIEYKKTKTSNEIRFQFSTTGAGIDFFPHEPADRMRLEERAFEQTTITEGHQHIFQIVVDTKDIKIGQQDKVLVEATFWNAFQLPEKSFLTLKMHTDKEQQILRLRFPSSWNDVRLDAMLRTSPESDWAPASRVGLDYDADSGTLIWNIEKPRAGEIYYLKWAPS